MLKDSNQKCCGDPNQKWLGIRTKNIHETRTRNAGESSQKSWGVSTQKCYIFNYHDGWGLHEKYAQVLDRALSQWRLSLANHSPSNSSCKTRGAPQNASCRSEQPENKFLSQSPKHRLFTHSKVPRLHLGWFTTFAPPAASITNRRSLFVFTLEGDSDGNPPSPANNQD